MLQKNYARSATLAVYGGRRPHHDSAVALGKSGELQVVVELERYTELRQASRLDDGIFFFPIKGVEHFFSGTPSCGRHLASMTASFFFR